LYHIYRKNKFLKNILIPWVHLTTKTHHALVLPKLRMTSLIRHSN